MAAILSLNFVVNRADGTSYALSVDAARAVIGSGAHCEIRLPPEQCPVEQLLVEAKQGSVFAEARSMHPPALLNGVPFTAGRILPESAIQIGGTELRVTLGEAFAIGAPKKSASSQKTNPLILVLGVVALPLGAYSVLASPPGEANATTQLEPPALFGQKAESTCPQNGASEALAVAEDERGLADSKRERSPFRTEEGVAAVGHYERASACFRSAGNAASANETKLDADNLKRIIERDFHVHGVRLERALATKQYDRARTEIQVLLGFVSGHPGEYANWLSTLDRRIQLKYSSKTKEP
jgi:hypothetical protein